VGGFILIPEVRFDSAKDAIYAKASNSGANKTAFSFIMAAVYSF